MSVSGRPGAYITTKTGATHTVMESYHSVLELIAGFSKYGPQPPNTDPPVMFEVHDHYNRKLIALSSDQIESVREGGY